MERKVIESSRMKTVLYLLGCLGFCAVAIFFIRTEPGEDAWKMLLCLAFFGIAAAVLAVGLFRPERLILDGHGFTLEGGFTRTPRTVAWRDVQAFVVWRLPKGGKMVGYHFRAPGPPRPAPTGRPQGMLSSGWTLSAEALADELNAWRSRATGAQH